VRLFAVKNHYPSPRFRRPTRVPGIPQTGATDEDILNWLAGYYQFLRDHFDSLDIPTSFLEFGEYFCVFGALDALLQGWRCT